MSERTAQWRGEKEVAAVAAATAQGRPRVYTSPTGQQVAHRGLAGGSQEAQGAVGQQVVRGRHRGRHRVARGHHQEARGRGIRLRCESALEYK